MQNRQGFTLIELICVLALLGVIAAIAIPRVQPLMQELELRREAQQMASILRNCRSQAILQGEVVQVFFRVYDQPPSYQVHWANESGGVNNRIETFYLENGISYFTNFSGAAGLPRCVFYHNGRSSGGSVTLKQGKAKREVIVYPQTARVRVSP